MNLRRTGKLRSSALKNESTLYGMKGKAAKQAGNLGAGADLLAGLSDTAGYMASK